MFPKGTPDLVEPIYKNALLSAPFNEQLAAAIRAYALNMLQVCCCVQHSGVRVIHSHTFITETCHNPRLANKPDLETYHLLHGCLSPRKCMSLGIMHLCPIEWASDTQAWVCCTEEPS